MTQEVVLTPEDLETFATRSLTGLLVTRFNEIPKELNLVFTQTTMNWKRENGGPDHWVLPEHTLPCLMEDIVSLIQQGVKIQVEMRDMVKSS